MEIEKLIRKNIWELQPYSCAREEYEGGQALSLIHISEPTRH